ncbi:hypothetical protein PRVXH_000615 [Proteinivorax hydrogeniformans]|uniref:FMN-binding protein n=1 Tax=Proteinivorax hydrogeniformans TaxID=1826727 RepID=A0AAU8HV75_9FIRM
MKKISKMFFVLLLTLTLSFAAVGCSEAESTSLAGQYVGYSWRGEASGVAFEDADRYIETILELDEDGIITDAKMRFFRNIDGYWTTRQAGNAFVDVDFSVDPTFATPDGDDYTPGQSMFTIHTADMMSFYATAVDSNGDVALAIVDPMTRYQFEAKLPADFNFSQTVEEGLSVGSGNFVPTSRTGGSHPAEFEDYDENTIFDIHGMWSHVVNDKGELEGVDNSSTVQEFVEALGVEFVDGKPQAQEAEYGYFGLGGWDGNYRAIEEYLVGQDATELTSLVDWSNSRYEPAINEDNEFGADVPSGATRTAQDSVDTITGATVRMSRESTSFQRALENAGIIDESDIIIGRF